MIREQLAGAALAALLLAAGGMVSAAETADHDLEAGLAYLRAGHDALATEHLIRYYHRQANPNIRRQVDVTLAQLRQSAQPLTQDERERAVSRLQDIVQTLGRSKFALEWRYRNFPVFP